MLMCISILGNVCLGATDGSQYEFYENEICDGQYAIMSESADEPLIIRCSSLSVKGRLFSNCAVDAQTKEKYVTSEDISVFTYNLYQDVFDMARDFEYHEGSYSLSGNKVPVNAYAADNMNISGNGVECDELVGAGQSLDISASKVNNVKGNNETTIFSLNGSVRINAEVIDLSGMIYAPNGTVEINAKNFTFSGIIVADKVVINANRVSLNANDIKYDITTYVISDEDIFDGNILEAGSVSGSSLSSSGDGKYYYNTGGKYTGGYYNKYGLKARVKVGDIVYEAAGGWGLTGHIAVIHSIQTNYIYGEGRVESWINVIEAIDKGVCYGLLDDKRCDDKGVTILRVSNLSSDGWNKVRKFLEAQLDKPYSLVVGRRNSSISSKSWYCSELAWAAFKYAGYEIERSETLQQPGVTPKDIYKNSKLVKVSYK